MRAHFSISSASSAPLMLEPISDSGAIVQVSELLRKKVFAAANAGEVEFDALLDKVLTGIPWTQLRLG